MIHDLKIYPCFFNDVIYERKTFEVRKNDRDFTVGDMLFLREYDPLKLDYTDRSCFVLVTYILDDPAFCKEGFCILSFNLLRWSLQGEYFVP